MVWGVFTDKHVDANCRTVNLMFFFKLPYFGLVNCRTQSVFFFDNISVKSRSLQIKLIPNVISNMLIILALKMRRETVLNTVETNIF